MVIFLCFYFFFTLVSICLAVSPSMKAYGQGGRARLFEVVEKMRDAPVEL